MEEIYRICDRITILTEGRRDFHRGTGRPHAEQIVEAIVGRRMNTRWNGRNATPHRNGCGAPAAGAQLTAANGVTDMSFSLRPGDFSGCGLMGSGRNRTDAAVFGIDRPVSGEILRAAYHGHR